MGNLLQYIQTIQSSQQCPTVRTVRPENEHIFTFGTMNPVTNNHPTLPPRCCRIARRVCIKHPALPSAGASVSSAELGQGHHNSSLCLILHVDSAERTGPVGGTIKKSWKEKKKKKKCRWCNPQPPVQVPRCEQCAGRSRAPHPPPGRLPATKQPPPPPPPPPAARRRVPRRRRRRQPPPGGSTSSTSPRFLPCPSRSAWREPSPSSRSPPPSRLTSPSSSPTRSRRAARSSRRATAPPSCPSSVRGCLRQSEGERDGRAR